MIFCFLFGENVFLRSSLQEVFYKEGFLRNFTKFTGNTCGRVSFIIKLQAQTCNFIKIEDPAQVFPCEFCEISKSTFSYRTPPVAIWTSLLPK